MTAAWDRFKATGKGQLAWRVSIDGVEKDLVTHSNMSGTPSGERTRILGLKSDGFKFGQEVDLATGHAEGASIRVKFANAKAGAALFSKRPTSVSYLKENETSTTTTIRCDGATSFATSGYAHLNTEAFSYTATSSAGFLGCVRGSWNTLRQNHYTGSGDRLRFPEITDQPVVLEGRRVRFYVYAPGDDKQGAGTLVWVGLMRTQPNFNGVVWAFQVDSLFSVFDTDLGSDLADPTRIRGIYYPEASPLVIQISEGNATTWPGSAIEGAFAICGFWETQEDFLTDVNTALAAELTRASFTQTDIYAVKHNDSWAIEFIADGASPKFISIAGGSAVDWFESLPVATDDQGGPAVISVVAGKSYRFNQPNGGWGTVPRATLGGFDGAAEMASGLLEAQKTNFDGTHIPYRLYLGSSTGITSNTTAVEINWESPDAERTSTAFSGVIETSVDAVNASGRYIDVIRPAWARPDGDRVISDYAVGLGLNVPTVRMGRRYTTGGGNFSDFLGISGSPGLLTQTKEFMNTGAVPYLRPTDNGVTGDINMSTPGNEIDAAAAASAFLGRREYSVFSEVDLRELVEHECRLLGIYPVIEDGQYIVFKRLRLAAPSELVATGAAYTITGATIISDPPEFLVWEDAPLGVYNTIQIKTGYNPIEEKHTGARYTIRDVAAYGQSPTARVLPIEPLSAAVSKPAFEDVVDVGARFLGAFGGQYAYLDLTVSLVHWDLNPGDLVSLTWSKIPDSTGQLGVTAKLALVVATEWEPMKAVGTVRLMVTDQKIAGYTPASTVNTVTAGTSGTVGPFTVDLSTTGFPSGKTAADFYAVGDKVRAFRVDDLGEDCVDVASTADLSANEGRMIRDAGPEGAAAVRGAFEFNSASGCYFAGLGTAAQWTALTGNANWITVWVYPRSSQSGQFRVIATFYGGSTDSEADNILAQIGIEDNDKMWLFYEYSAGTNVSLASTGTELTHDAWNRLDFVRDGAGNIDFYLNGALDDNWTSQQLATGGTTARNIRIGGNAGGGQLVDGKVYGLELRDVAATAGDIDTSVATAPGGDTIGMWCIRDSVPGVVTSVTSNSLTFSADRVWTYSTNSWAIGYRASSTISAANQKVFGYIARSDNLVDFSDETDLPPYTLAP